MKQAPDREISGGFTFVNKNRPPTFEKNVNRPTIRNQIDNWNDSVFSVDDSTQKKYNLNKPHQLLDTSHMVGIHGHP